VGAAVHVIHETYSCLNSGLATNLERNDRVEDCSGHVEHVYTLRTRSAQKQSEGMKCRHTVTSPLALAYEGVSKSFRTGRLERELQMAQLSTTRCSCIAIL
jgi:hypothetical protein